MMRVSQIVGSEVNRPWEDAEPIDERQLFQSCSRRLAIKYMSICIVVTEICYACVVACGIGQIGNLRSLIDCSSVNLLYVLKLRGINLLRGCYLIKHERFLVRCTHLFPPRARLDRALDLDMTDISSSAHRLEGGGVYF